MMTTTVKNGNAADIYARFYLDKEKDIIVDLFREGEELAYVLSTPNHGTGNLITNLARLCDLPLSKNEQGLLVIRGKVPSYFDGYNRLVYIFRMGDTKIANIYPAKSGQSGPGIEIKAHIPAISKTLMSQTKDYRLDIQRTIVKTYIHREHKFRTDLHTHMNANLAPDLLIALGISHQIRYPLYYIKKLQLKISEDQAKRLGEARALVEEKYADCGLTGKYLTRRIDDHTFLNFADLILGNLEDAAYNIPRIRSSLTILKDGQAVFTNLEKVYLYRYVFAKGRPSEEKYEISPEKIRQIPDGDIVRALIQISNDRDNPDYKANTLFQDKLLWIARSYARQGVKYAEISDTTLVKKDGAREMLAQVHQVMPAITRETGVVLRFLAAIRRIPLTIIKDQVVTGDYFHENLEVLKNVAADPYVAGSDIIGEELNNIRDIAPVIREIVRIAAADPTFVIRIHAGENDGLRDNVAGSLQCIKEALAPGQAMPLIRIGHGLYTADLKRPKGQELVKTLQECKAVLEFQITSNVRLNNLSDMKNHPLRQYLAHNIGCVQGTDGGALYGTDSIDEQLSLEKMLDLTDEELLKMRQCEDRVLKISLDNFRQKQKNMEEGRVPEYPEIDHKISMMGKRVLPSAQVLADRICDMPGDDFRPIVIVGGSFSQEHQRIRMTETGKRMIDRLLREEDPEKTCFVIGHTLRGYEQYLVQNNQGRFPIYAIIPSMITEGEHKKLARSGVKIRVSIEPVPMGTYKSFAYEIFKRRPSVLYAFDGNIAGANMIQEAKNSKYPCRIYVNRRSRALRIKAQSLGGYVHLFE